MNKDIILLVDVEEWSEEVTFGTCEFCFYNGEQDFQDLIFKQGDETFKIPMDHFLYGDYLGVHIRKKHIISFADYIKKQCFTDKQYLIRNIANIYFDFCDTLE